MPWKGVGTTKGDDLEWVSQLQVPGLILAGGVIGLLCKLLFKLTDHLVEIQRQRTEERSLQAEMITMLRQLTNMDRPRGRE